VRLQGWAHGIDPVLDSKVLDHLFSRLDRIDAERDDHDTMTNRNVIEHNVERLGTCSDWFASPKTCSRIGGASTVPTITTSHTLFIPDAFHLVRLHQRGRAHVKSRCPRLPERLSG